MSRSTSYLASRSTLPLCSRTSQTQATCSWVKPKLVREGAGGEGRAEWSRPPAPDMEAMPMPGRGKPGNCDRQEGAMLGGPTPENAEKREIVLTAAA